MKNNDLQDRLENVLARVERAAAKAQRDPKDVHLLPVSKGQNVSTLLAALDVAHFPRCFGENYLAELQEKELALRTKPIEWHFMGALQSRKIPEIIACAAVIHSVSRVKELEFLAQNLSKKVEFYLQVNISSEDQKNGCAADELPALIEAVEKLKLSHRLLGLMGMAAPLAEVGEKAVRKSFEKLRKLRDQELARGKLNMGMSDDFEVAIQEGSQRIRLGSALFGARIKTA